MPYTFKYRLMKAPESTLDGSGVVKHDVAAIASLDGESWNPVPDRHKSVMVPGDQLQSVLDLPNGSSKIAAYKSTLVANVSTVPVPSSKAWSIAAMEELMLINDATEAVTAEANDYITVTLNQTYPLDFNL